jgi:hypothetical protein
MHLFLHFSTLKSTIDLKVISNIQSAEKHVPYRLHHDTSDLIGISIGSWSSVFKVTVSLSTTLSWDSDRCATVGNTICEGIDATSLVFTSKAHGVIFSVNSNVLLVTTFKLLDGGFNVLHTTLHTHLLGREVAVKTGSVPVTWDWLGVEGDLGTELLSDTV